MMGIKLAMVYSIKMTSMAKITPAKGVLNDAAMAAAAPQPTKTRMLLFGRRTHCPSMLALEAPRWILGPSRPTDCPLIKLIPAPKICSKVLRIGMRP